MHVVRGSRNVRAKYGSNPRKDFSMIRVWFFSYDEDRTFFYAYVDGSNYDKFIAVSLTVITRLQ